VSYTDLTNTNFGCELHHRLLGATQCAISFWWYMQQYDKKVVGENADAVKCL